MVGLGLGRDVLSSLFLIEFVGLGGWFWCVCGGRKREGGAGLVFRVLAKVGDFGWVGGMVGGRGVGLVFVVFDSFPGVRV